MTIQKLIGILGVAWVLVFGVLVSLKHEEKMDVEGDFSEFSSSTVDIAFLDIGQGDATFITFKDGQQMLIDCAIDARILEALDRQMPFYDRTIDFLAITHPDQDHYGGCIDVLDRFEVHTIIYNGYQKEESVYWQAFMDSVQSEGSEYVVIDEPQIWNIASTTVAFLYPDHAIADDPNVPGYDRETGANNSSLVMLLKEGETEVLMTGDGEEELETFLLTEYGTQIDVDILKAGHHGSNSSSIEPFVDVTSPNHVIFSAGLDNRYGHPSPRILKRYERIGSRIWRTDTMGDILVSIGEDMLTINDELFSVDNSNQYETSFFDW